MVLIRSWQQLDMLDVIGVVDHHPIDVAGQPKLALILQALPVIHERR
jgi:hypothetical protein